MIMQIFIETHSRDARVKERSHNFTFHENSSLVFSKTSYFLLWELSNIHTCEENALWNPRHLLLALSGYLHMDSLSHTSLIILK